MATWNLSPQYKKSAVEKMFFYKDGKCITIEQGFRWANFTVRSDERPLTDYELKNEDGYDLGSIDNDESWEMQDMSDGCWCDIEIGNDKTTSTDLEEFEIAWGEDWYSGVEAIGWSQDDTEYYYYGPLELTNEDTGEVFKGEPDEDAISIGGVPVKTEEQLKAELDELIDSMPAIHMSNTSNPVDFPAVNEEPVVTEWYPASINPVRVGTYQVLDCEQEVAWPFQSNILAGTWDGKKWDISVSTTVVKWRGLANNPEA
jgi:hypothetical protein